ncbi:MAG: FtsX-like permease family protein [Treponema sp.]|nr:FtsX-like permease family protein [Treponema sp.]
MQKSTIRMAARNLSRQKRRSFMLALAIGFGFLVVTAIDGLAGGAVKCLEDQISQMQGGNVFVQGVEHLKDEDGNITKKFNAIIRNRKYIENIVTENVKDYEYYSMRTQGSGTLIFNNKKVESVIWGVDFTKEDHLLDSLVLVSGNLEELSRPNSLILSEKTAKALKVEAGDTLLFSSYTLTMQKNVGELYVAAISKDPSLLSSAMCYAAIDYINEIMELPEDSYTMFSISLKEKNKQNAVAQVLENKIREDGNIVTSRADAYKAAPTNPAGNFRKQLNNTLEEGTLYSAFSLTDAIPQLGTVVQVVHIVTTIILLVILLIVMVGISNTYRMILYERIKEIGTMRAIGMTGKQSGQLFTTEAVILSLLGAVGGCICAILIMVVVSFFHIENESLSFFLHNGRLTWTLSVGSVLAKYVIMIILTILAVRGTSSKVSKMWPAQALR